MENNLKDQLELSPAASRGASREKPDFAWRRIIDFSRTGFALWVWAELIRCHDTLVLCLLGAALTVLQADPCCVIYSLTRKSKGWLVFSILLWLALVAFTWAVVYKNWP